MKMRNMALNRGNKMKNKMKSLGTLVPSIVTNSSATAFTYKHAKTLLFGASTALLIIGLEGGAIAQESYATPDFQPELIEGAVGNLFALIEGAFGALIMVVSGLAAIVAASMGAYRAAVSMLVVALGAFILRALVSLFFGTNFPGIGVDGSAS